MPVGVVQLLEVVDVQEEQGEVLVVAPGPLQFVREALLEVAVVVEARQPVGEGHLLDLLVEGGVGDLGGDLVREESLGCRGGSG